MNEAKQRRVLANSQQEFDAWSRVNSVSLRGFRPGRGGDTLGTYSFDLFLKELVESLDTPLGKVVILGLVSTMLLTACVPVGTSPTSAGEIQQPGVTVIAPDHTPGLTAIITSGPEQPALTPIATLRLTEDARQPASQEAQFFSLPALLPSIGGQGRLETISNPAATSTLAEDYIILYGNVSDGTEIGGGRTTNLSGIRLCSQTGCFGVSSVFPEKIADGGLEYLYSPQDSQDGAIVYQNPNSSSRLVFINRFPDRSGEGLRFVTAVDRQDAALLGLWIDAQGQVVDRISHVRSLSGNERLKVDLENGLVQVGNELIEIGQPAWQAAAGGENLLATGQWGRVEGVKVLADGNLEIKGYGGQDGWNTPINPQVKLSEISGDFSIQTRFSVNPESSFAGIVLMEGQRANGEWWRTKRLDVSIRNGGEGVWIGYWDGSKQSAETMAEVTGLNLDPNSPHDFELRFSVEENQVSVWVDGQRVGSGSLGQLLDQRQLRMGFNADPEAVLTVSQVAIEVPEGGDGNLVITGLTGIVQPTPGGEITVTAAPPNPSPSPGGGEIQPFTPEPSPTALSTLEIIGPPPFGEAPKTLEQLWASMIEVGESSFYENRVIRDHNLNIVQDVDIVNRKVLLDNRWIDLSGTNTQVWISQCRSTSLCEGNSWDKEDDFDVFPSSFSIDQILPLLKPGQSYIYAFEADGNQPAILEVQTVAMP